MIDAYNNPHDYEFKSNIGKLKLVCCFFFAKEKGAGRVEGEPYNPLDGALCVDGTEIDNFYGAWNIINGKIDWKFDKEEFQPEDREFINHCETELSNYLKYKSFL